MDSNEVSLFGSEKIGKILLKIAPPVMFAQLIQALYNIVDSFFVGRYSEKGLTALSVIFPVQFVIIALAVGTGVGVNTYMAKEYALGREEDAEKTAGTGIVLAIIMWAFFSLAAFLFLKYYIQISASSPEAVEYANTYGMIVCIGSLGIFLESIFTKIHQASGNMKIPMAAQVVGALVNIVLDPVLIFGLAFIPPMGIAGAALATVIGQFAAAAITGITAFRRPPKAEEILEYGKAIYQLGYPQILMQMLMTLYIVVLNVILARFSDEAVTVLGLYYKVQTFFFIPLLSLNVCIVPVLSYNYARGDYGRCHRLMKETVFISVLFMLVGIFCFEVIPDSLIRIFSKDVQTVEIGRTAFRIIGLSFIPAVFSLVSPVYFQAVGKALPSVILSLTRQIFCLIPVFWGLSFIGLDYTWFAFPVAETITGTVGVLLYLRSDVYRNCG